MTTELNSFADAAALAIAEFEQASLDDAGTPMPGVEADAVVGDGQAEADATEQADSQDTKPVDEPDGDDESLFADLEIEEESSAPTVSDDAVFELPGVEGQVTLQELKDGYLRQSDYTQKTQRLSEDRKTNEKAVQFWDALRAQPDAVVRQLAVQAGLIDEGAAPFKAVEFSPIRTSDEVEAEIAARVERAVAEHPSVVEAQRRQAVATIDAEFDRIGQEAGVVISAKDRETILREAQRRQVGDLELVFTSLMAQREKLARERTALKDAAPARPTGAATTEAVDGPADSFREAARRALVELGMSN